MRVPVGFTTSAYAGSICVKILTAISEVGLCPNFFYHLKLHSGRKLLLTICCISCEARKASAPLLITGIVLIGLLKQMLRQKQKWLHLLYFVLIIRVSLHFHVWFASRFWNFSKSVLKSAKKFLGTMINVPCTFLVSKCDDVRFVWTTLYRIHTCVNQTRM